MKNFTRQESKVYSYILAHPGCTTMDMQQALHIECPSARLTGLRNKGVKIISIGKKRYPGAHAFEMYALEGQPKPRQVVEHLANGTVRVSYI